MDFGAAEVFRIVLYFLIQAVFIILSSCRFLFVVESAVSGTSDAVPIELCLHVVLYLL